MTSWALTRLMRSHRERADGIDVQLFTPLASPTRDAYRRFLADVYGFVAAFEPRFASTERLDLSFIQARIKSGRIASDLLALGLTSADYARLAQPYPIPELGHPLDGLGWLVVVERLIPMLAPLRARIVYLLPREIEIAGRFLATYECDVEARWEQLGHMIDACIRQEADYERLHAAAGAAFALFDRGLRGSTAIDADVQVQSA